MGTSQLPEVKEFVRLVAGSPLHEIGRVLQGFTWKYEKGCIFQWADALDRMDEWYETYVAPRKEFKLLLEDEEEEEREKEAAEGETAGLGDGGEEGTRSSTPASGTRNTADAPFPREDCMSILKASSVILENCNNRGSYGSVEHVALLLASFDAELVCTALQLLSIVFRRTWHQGHSKWSSDANLNERLITLAQGWGGQAQGLGLIDCVAMESGKPRLDARKLGQHICFRFTSDAGPSTSAATSHSTTEIKLPLGGSQGRGNEREIFQQIVREYRVSKCMKTRLSLLMRVRVSLLMSHIEGRRLLAKLRLLALICVQHVRPNTHSTQLSAMYSSEPELFTELIVIQREADVVPESIRALALRAAGATVASRGRGSVVLLQQRSLAASVLNSLMRKVTEAMCKGEPSSDVGDSFAEALLALIAALLSTANGCSVLSEAGAVPSLLPLLDDLGDCHILLVTHVVRVLEAFIDVSQNAADAFLELNGAEALVNRLEVEVDKVVNSSCEANYNRRLLIKALLRAIGLACFGSGNTPFPSEGDGPMGRLLSSLANIFKLVRNFGSGVFSLAASVMAEHIHNDPRGYSVLEKEDLPVCFLKAVVSGVPLSSDAISAIPGAIAALCLNECGKEAVVKSGAVKFLVPIVTAACSGDVEAMNVFHGQTASLLGTSLDELMRHVPSLCGDVIDSLVMCLDEVARQGGCAGLTAAEAAAIPVDSEAVDSNLHRVVEAMASMLDSSLASTPSATSFCEKGGFGKTLRLLCLPANGAIGGRLNDDIQSTGRAPTSLNYTFSQLVRGLIQRCSSQEFASVELAETLTAAVRSSLIKTDAGGRALCGSATSEERPAQAVSIPSCMRMEPLALLASSVLKAWPYYVSAFITAGLYEQLGQLHTCANWQLMDPECVGNNESGTQAAEEKDKLVRIMSTSRNLLVASVKACGSPSRGDIPASDLQRFARNVLQIWHYRIPAPSYLGLRKRCLFLHHAVDELGVLLFDIRRHTCNASIFPMFTETLLGPLLEELVDISGLSSDADEETRDAADKFVDSIVVLLEHTVSAPILLSAPAAVLGELMDDPVEHLHVKGMVEQLKLRVAEGVLRAMHLSSRSPVSVRSSLVALLACAADLDGLYEEAFEVLPELPESDRQQQPLPETAIRRIMETGFSRERAETALRASTRGFHGILSSAGDILVNLAVEWLLSHPEEDVGSEAGTDAQDTTEYGQPSTRLAEVDDGKVERVPEDPTGPWSLTTLKRALELLGEDGDAFAMADLAHSLATQHKGRRRVEVIEFLLGALKSGNHLKLVAHACALLAAHDNSCHKALADANLADVVLEILEKTWNDSEKHSAAFGEAYAALLVALTTLLQQEPKVKKHNLVSEPETLDGAIDGDTQGEGETEGNAVKSLGDVLSEVAGSSMGHLSNLQQLRALRVAIDGLKLAAMQPSQSAPLLAQAASELAARLTRSPVLARQFYLGGGVPLVIHLPSFCWFQSFDVIGSAILRHVVEDAGTLKVRFESEIRRALSSSPAQSDGQHHLLLRVFLQMLVYQVSREPNIFAAAVAETCTLRHIGGRDYVCLKEAHLDSENELKPVTVKLENTPLKKGESVGDKKSKDRGNSEQPPRTPRRKVPSSFVFVIDQLASVVLGYNGSPVSSSHGSEPEYSKGKKRKRDKRATPHKGDASDAAVDSPSGMQKGLNVLSVEMAETARVAFCLDVLVSLLPYPGATSLFMKRDNGLIHHLLHGILFELSQPGCSKEEELVAAQAARLLGTFCVHSSEGRKRIFSEISGKLRAEKRASNLVLALLQSLLESFELSPELRSKLSRKAADQVMQQTLVDAARSMKQANIIHALLAILSSIDFSDTKAADQVEMILNSLEGLVRLTVSTKPEKAMQGALEGKGELDQQGYTSAMDGVVARISQILGSESALRDEQDASMAEEEYDTFDEDLEEDSESEDSLDEEDDFEGDETQDEDSDIMDDSEFDAEDMEAGASDGEPPPLYRGLAGDSTEMTLEESEDDEDNVVEQEEQDDEEDDTGEEGSDDGDTFVDDGEDDYFEGGMDFIDEEDLSAEDEEEITRDEELISEGDVDIVDGAHEMYYAEDEVLEDDNIDDGEPQLIEVRWQAPARMRRTGSYLQEAMGSMDADRHPPLRAMRSLRDLDGNVNLPSGNNRRWQLRQSRGSERNIFSAATSLSLTHPLLLRNFMESSVRQELPLSGLAESTAQSMLRSGSGQFASLIQVVGGTSGGEEIHNSNRRDPIFNGSTPGRPYVSVIGARRDGGRHFGGSSSRLRESLDYTLNPALLEAPTESLHNPWTLATLGSRAVHPSALTPVGNPATIQDSLEQHMREILGARGNEAGDVEGENAEEHDQEDTHGEDAGAGHGISALQTHPPESDLQVSAVPSHEPMPPTSGDPSLEAVNVQPSVSGQIAVVNGNAQGREEDTHGSDRVPVGESSEADPAQIFDAQTIAAAEAAGIDPTVLAELPPDLRAEVMASHMAMNHAVPVRATDAHEGGQEMLDPEFLAALPQDIAEELRASQSRSEVNTASDLDNATILASFPPSIREEVLLTAGDNFLASLPVAMLAEAHALRGLQHDRQQATNTGEADLNRGLNQATNNDFATAMRNTISELLVGTQRRLDRNTTGHHHAKKDKKEFQLDEDEEELIDGTGVAALVRLLRVAAPLHGTPLSLVLSNFSWHPKTCAEILRQLCLPLSATESMCKGDKDPFGLLGGGGDVVYSKAPDGEGAPPLLTGRTLETLRQMASLNRACARMMLSEKLACNGTRTVLQLVTSLLHRPLYRRSPFQLDSALRLIESLCLVASNAQKSVQPSKVEEKVLQETALAASDSQFSAQIAAILGSVNVPSGTKSKCLSCLEAVVASSPLEASQNFVVAFSQEISKCAVEATLLLQRVSEQHQHGDEVGNIGSAVLRLVKAAIKAKKIVKSAAIDNGKATDAAESSLKAAMKRETEESQGKSTEGEGNPKDKAADPKKSEPDGDQIVIAAQENFNLLKRKQETLQRALDCVRELESKLLMDLSNLWESMDAMATSIESQMSLNLQPKASAPPRTVEGEVESVQEGTSSGRVAARLPPDAALVTPVIEAFFLLAGASTQEFPLGGGNDSGSESLEPVQHPGRASLAPMVPSCSTPDTVDACRAGTLTSSRPFSQFARGHRMLLNAILQRNPMLLQGAFSPLLQTPHLLDFGNKRSYFRAAVRSLPSRSSGSIRLHIRRDHVFDDSYHQLRVRSPSELRGKLNVQFTGEEGVDAGGLTREWYQLLSREMFNVQNGLFECSADGSLQPSPSSEVQPDHLSFFKFAGRFVAKAVLDGHLVDVHFTRSFYKHLLGVPITYEDIEAVDPDFYKNLKWMLENSIDGVLDLTFSTEASYFGKTDVVELKEGGVAIPVTDANKAEYVNLVAENRMTGAIRPQIKAFLEAFRELLPPELTAVFNPSELELLISGLPHVDIEDLRANTEYSGYTVGSPVIQWFWELVRKFGRVDKSRLIQFVTGTSKVPIGGFSELQGVSGPQKFQIHRSYKPKNSLPCAHTCFNQLDLVEYDSKEILYERLLTAIREGSEGFGFA